MSYLLSEDNIKKATLSFLKTYYKDNSSRGFGNTDARVDMKAGEGIIADGYLRFSTESDSMAMLSPADAEKLALEDQKKKKGHGKSFLATFEATAQSTAEEIQYRVQNSLLIADALAFASIIAAVSYGYNFMNDQFTLNQLGTFKFVGGFFAVMLASVIAFLLIFRNLMRYRYIYALAQFRKYHADEQWISYGEDVFANPGNKYLKELKKQCIRQGFGLISVDKNLQPSLVITPARERKSGFRSKAKMIFENQTENNPVLKRLPRFRLRFKKNKLDTQDYTRFTKSYWKQVCVVLAMLFVMGEIYLEELKNPNIIYLDAQKYENQVRKATAENLLEPADYVEPDSTPVPRNNENLPATENKKPSTNLQNNKDNEVRFKDTEKKDALIIATTNNELVSYSCSRLSYLKGNQFLVQIALTKSKAEAIKKVKDFNNGGFKANALWLGCFSNNQEYVVYLDDIFNNKNAAVERASQFQKLMVATQQNQETFIRMIQGS